MDFLQDFKQVSHLRKKRKLLALSAYAVDEKYGFTKGDFQWAAAKVKESFLLLCNLNTFISYLCFIKISKVICTLWCMVRYVELSYQTLQ